MAPMIPTDAQRRTALLLLAIGIAGRLVPHPWNVTPLIAVALLGGALLPLRWAVGLPVVIAAASDILLGWHTTLPFTWAGFALAAGLGTWLRRPSVGRVALGAVTASTVFFVVSNLGVWLVGGLYPATREGLAACFVAAIPFFRQMLIGDVLCTLGFFGIAAVMGRLPFAVRAR